MADRVSLSNRAMGLLGEDDQLIDPLDDTKAARTIAAVWDQVRRDCLRQMVANFADETVELQQLAITAPPPWSAVFQLPTKMIRLIGIVEPDIAKGDYALNRHGLCTRVGGPIYARVIIDEVNCARWDDLFATAFVCRLAWQCAERITGDRQRKADAWAAWEEAAKVAGLVDAQENPASDPDIDPWEAARY
ncbi:hypothetical protein [Rhizorhabdus sp.]|uniref:hypothetical protein n=1 Tax=Rhizorhabdus sp. TaxID=1968843 RepID=UPI0035ADE6DB